MHPATRFGSFLALISVLLLFSCEKLGILKKPLTEELSGRWYQILDDRIEERRDFTVAPTGFKPWTVQSRITDITALGDSIYLAINGSGIARFSATLEEMEYHYDPLIFRFRTITTLIPQEQSILCHLYFNKMLNVTSEDRLKIQGISLLRLFPEDGIYQFIIPPFQELHPDWESVGFVPENENLFYFEWKYSDREETKFEYTRLSFPGTKAAPSEEPTQRLSFRRAFQFKPIDRNLPRGLDKLVKTAMKRLNTREVSAAYHLLLRRSGKALIERYEHHPEDFTQAREIEIHTLHAFQEGKTYYLLLPKGPILRTNPRGEPLTNLLLPRLPEDFQYTDLFVSAGNLIIPWEQNAFTEVGAAGLYVSSPEPENQ